MDLAREPYYYPGVQKTLVRSSGSRGKGDEPTPLPHLFLILEGRRPRAGGVRYRLSDFDDVVIGRGKTREVKETREGDRKVLRIDVPDPWMSSVHARIQRRGQLLLFRDAGSTNGSLVGGEETREASLVDRDVVELGQTIFYVRTSLSALRTGPAVVDGAMLDTPRGLTSLLPSLARDFETLSRVAQSSAPVVLSGATGSGKEVVAKSVHELSGRSGEFVAVNCGAIPDNLVESTFFGHMKGAFSGAAQASRGLILTADGGTLFLDEIGDLPLASQAALLRVLQEKEVLAIGATRPVPVDFRLLCATHRDMAALVEAEKFREDLYARLSGFIMRLPSLDRRLEDLGNLIAAVLDDLRACPSESDELEFENSAIRALMAYDWPRNVRELHSCLQTALALSEGGAVQLEHLPDPVQQALEYVKRQRTDAQSSETSGQLSGEQERRKEEIAELLRVHQGNVSAVARAMDKSRSLVHRWIKRYGLEPSLYKSESD